MGAFRNRLNQARLAMAATHIVGSPEPPFAPLDEPQLDLERLLQHLDQAAEALNTTFHRLRVRVNATSPRDPEHAGYVAQTELVRAARMAVIAAREAGRKVGPVDYRVDEILY